MFNIQFMKSIHPHLQIMQTRSQKRKLDTDNSQQNDETDLVDEESDINNESKPPRQKAVKVTSTVPAKEFTIPFSDKKAIQCIRYDHARTSDAQAAFIFTHGARGSINSPGMTTFAHGFATISPIVLFEGTSNLAHRVKYFKTVTSHESVPSSTIGGRSMGGRAAVVTANEDTEEQIDALVLVSYPLVGANGKTREDILLDIKPGTDVLFISGKKDSMCDVNGLNDVREKMMAKSWLVQVEEADHGLSVSMKKGTERIGEMVGSIAAKWIQKRDEKATEMTVRWNGDISDVDASEWTER